ncbi:hypothetical protein D3C80_1679550 [compost metagenome]
MAVEARAQRQGPVFRQRHLVLQVDGLVVGLVRTAHQTGVLQLFFAVFATDGEEVPFVQGESQAAIEDVVL